MKKSTAIGLGNIGRSRPLANLMHLTKLTKRPNAA